MQLALLFVVLIIAAPFFVFASPVIMYVIPLIVLGLVLSLITDWITHHSGEVGH